jgi:hypothetical protein
MAPKRKTQGGGAGDPKTSADESARIQRAAADAQMFVASTDRDGKDAAHHNRAWPEPQDAAPTVGKTGGRGARAERPSPVSDRKEAARPLQEVTRSSKPPAETPKARTGRSGQRQRSGGSGPKAAAS